MYTEMQLKLLKKKNKLKNNGRLERKFYSVSCLASNKTASIYRTGAPRFQRPLAASQNVFPFSLKRKKPCHRRLLFLVAVFPHGNRLFWQRLNIHGRSLTQRHLAAADAPKIVARDQPPKQLPHPIDSKNAPLFNLSTR